MDRVKSEAPVRDETELAEKLKSLCTSYGEERTDTLSQSADILMGLGKIYTQKAKQAKSSIEQKLAGIQSCALLNGAKVRFRTLADSSKVREADDNIMALLSVIFEQLGSRISPKRIMKFQTDLYKRLQTLRKEIAGKLEKLAKIEDTVTGHNRFEMEKEKIERIQEILSANTQSYKELMCDVSNICLEVLGCAPCKFAGVGLGSLARREITLYSDFEHVIILEEGVQRRKTYKKVKEYFRRFAMLFQIIIISLGETFIRSVGVPCLNDLYSGDKSKDWYYDIHTPSGISFDGMVPHSCHNPLGRQQATKERKHVVELIQPVKAMAKLLTHAQEVKNGYYLKDILTRTCLAYGNEQVHTAYVDAAKNILSSDDIRAVAAELFFKIFGNVNQDIAHEPLYEMSMKYVDAKSRLYRPLTGLLSYLGRVYNVSAQSSFDLVKVLRSQNIINEKACHDLQLAVAIACEVRIRIYADAGHQRHKINPKELLNMIGTQTETDVREILSNLREVTKNAVVSGAGGEMMIRFAKQNSLKNFDFRPNKPKSKLASLLEAYRYEEAANWCEEMLQSHGPNPELQIMLGTIYHRLGTSLSMEAKFHLAAAEFTHKDMDEMIHITFSGINTFCRKIAVKQLRSCMTRCNVKPNGTESRILSLIERGFYIDAERLLWQNRTKLEFMFEANLRTLNEYSLAKAAVELRDTFWQKGEKVSVELLHSGVYSSVQDLCYIYRHQKRYLEAQELLSNYAMYFDFDAPPSYQNFSIAHGIKMQVQRHTMEAVEFLDCLKANLKKAQPFELRVRILREVAMVRARLDQDGEARAILSELVGEIRSNVRALREQFILWFLEKIADTQRKQNWRKDALETIDFMLDLVVEGRCFQYLAHEQSRCFIRMKKDYILVESGQFDASADLLRETKWMSEPQKAVFAAGKAVSKAVKRSSAQVRLALVKSAIKVCREHPDCEPVVVVYVESLRVLFSRMDISVFSDVIDVYKEAPTRYQKHPTLHVPIYNYVHHHLSNFSTLSILDGDKEPAYHRVHTILDTFPEYVLEQPVIFLLTRYIVYVATRVQKDCGQRSVIRRLNGMAWEFMTKYCVPPNSAVAMHFDCAIIPCFVSLKRVPCAQICWWVLNKEQKYSFPKRMSIAFLYAIILCSM